MIEAGLEEEEPSILVIVIDADPTSWHHIHGMLRFKCPSSFPPSSLPHLPLANQLLQPLP